MSKLQEDFKNIINDLDEKIENKKDLGYIKNQIYNISMLFIEELDKISKLNEDKVDKLIVKHKELSSRIKELETAMSDLQNDIYEDIDDDEVGFEIICPYCDSEFEVDLSEKLLNEIECPKCNNIIELEWNGEDEYSSENFNACGGCSNSNCGTCGGCMMKNTKEYDEDDDM